MKNGPYKNIPVLVIGEGRLANSIAVSLVQAKHTVTLVTTNMEFAEKEINKHMEDVSIHTGNVLSRDRLQISSTIPTDQPFKLAIAITFENLPVKKTALAALENILATDTIIAINTEAIPLSELQKNCSHPSRVIGLNWVEPAHTTRFLEIIANTTSSWEFTRHLYSLAKQYWDKDPYIINNDLGIRARVMGALAREAFYLVENGYASVEDIDRACRNDAGYYLPFTGNYRYMDLMGTYAYGLVMKDLNRELSTDDFLPGFFEAIVNNGGLGMENGKGFYDYAAEDAEKWDEIFRTFSYQVKQIMDRYP